ncbi:2-dehydropantoate 2-reductase [Parvularcula flava]|uniref:2-dehydropantoate 2-reductase n=1 Tax=Aquisalinus luteolus TaxID=1566827 RepID=A0A8J3EUM1_9PROT|nr:2-dehydropantoate 2-reductase [Aquisalinus luteolus]NHK28167.1 2-dehydropantoate 2-reductase [Aquisalinus luteolus]GGH97666.1 2-dehydropantoate 2-reductase [Aquisalinus luteolus]
MKIAIIGPGAIGGTVAAWLGQDTDYEIYVCTRSPLPDGLAIELDGDKITAAPTVHTSPDDARPVDWVLSAAKTYDSANAAKWLPALTGETTRLAVLQNGIEQVENFRPFFDPARITPCIVDIPAERTAPGRVLQRRAGTVIVPDGPDGSAFAALFAHTPIAVTTTDDFASKAWAKLCINSAGAVNAITLQPSGIARFAPVAGLMRQIVEECAAVGRAEGAVLPDTIADDVVYHYATGDREGVNSIHADRLAGRPMEVQARNGVIVRLGEKHGIATPANRMAKALLEASMIDVHSL